METIKTTLTHEDGIVCFECKTTGISINGVCGSCEGYGFVNEHIRKRVKLKSFIKELKSN